VIATGHGRTRSFVVVVEGAVRKSADEQEGKGRGID